MKSELNNILIAISLKIQSNKQKIVDSLQINWAAACTAVTVYLVYI